MPYKKEIVSADIYEAINTCKKIETHINGEIITHDSNSAEFDEILSQMDIMLEGSREMPAFGVSLDNETKDAIKEGVWLKLIYDKTYAHNEMPFDSLLIQIEKDWTGFNIYRGNNGIYEGRCFYIDLVESDMSDLFELVISYSENN